MWWTIEVMEKYASPVVARFTKTTLNEAIDLMAVENAKGFHVSISKAKLDASNDFDTREKQQHVYVAMCNDFPECVFANQGDAEKFCSDRRKKKYQKPSDLPKPQWHWHSVPLYK